MQLSQCFEARRKRESVYQPRCGAPWSIPESTTHLSNESLRSKERRLPAMKPSMRFVVCSETSRIQDWRFSLTAVTAVCQSNRVSGLAARQMCFFGWTCCSLRVPSQSESPKIFRSAVQPLKRPYLSVSVHSKYYRRLHARHFPCNPVFTDLFINFVESFNYSTCLHVAVRKYKVMCSVDTISFCCLHLETLARFWTRNILDSFQEGTRK